MAKTGRKPLLAQMVQDGREAPTPEHPQGKPRMIKIGDAIVERVAAGLPVELAAESVGVGKEMVWEWLRRGKGQDKQRAKAPVYARFAEALTRARGRCAGSLIVELRKWAGKDPRVIMWMLERRFPEHFGRSDKLAVQATHGIDPQTVALMRRVPTMTDEELDALIQSGGVVDRGGLPALTEPEDDEP